MVCLFYLKEFLLFVQHQNILCDIFQFLSWNQGLVIFNMAVNSSQIWNNFRINPLEACFVWQFKSCKGRRGVYFHMIYCGLGVVPHWVPRHNCGRPHPHGLVLPPPSSRLLHLPTSSNTCCCSSKRSGYWPLLFNVIMQIVIKMNNATTGVMT